MPLFTSGHRQHSLFLPSLVVSVTHVVLHLVQTASYLGPGQVNSRVVSHASTQFCKLESDSGFFVGFMFVNFIGNILIRQMDSIFCLIWRSEISDTLQNNSYKTEDSKHMI